MYYQAVQSDAPMLYHRLAEASGSTFADASGNGRVGTKWGTPTMGITGPLNAWEPSDKALQLGQVLNTGYDFTMPRDLDTLTVEGFGYVNSYPTAGNFQHIIGTKVFGNSGVAGFRISIGNGNMFRVLVGTHDFRTAAVLPAVGNWFHWAVVLTTFDNYPAGGYWVPGSGKIEFYLNAVSTAIPLFTNTISMWQTTGMDPSWFVGAYGSSGLTPIHAVDEIAVYDVGLDPGTIASHYAARTNVAGTVPSYTDLTPRLRESISIMGYGKQDELGRVEPAKATFILDNKDRALEPENAASTYYPNVVPRRHFVLKAGENAVSNPSFEVNTTGWGAKGAGSIARDTATFLIGAAAGKVTPSTAAADGIMQSTGQSMTSGVAYTANAYVFGPVGVGMTLAIMDSGGTVVQASVTFTGQGFWQRVNLPYTPGSTATHRIAIYRTGTGTAAQIFYVDGVQLVVGNEQAYVDAQVILFDGYNEDWIDVPLGPTNAYVHIPCVDGLGVLQLPETHPRQWAQQKADLRIARALNMAGWPETTRVLEAGVYDILAESTNSEKIAEHCLSIGEAEGGLFFVDRSGDATLYNANHKTTAARSTTSQGTLSDWDTTTSGSYPYLHLERDAAARWIYNEITLAKVSGTPYTALDATSKNRYWRSSYEKTDLRLANDADVQTRLAALIARYKDFKVRPKAVTLKPRAHPGLWNLVLTAELWDRYLVDRHPQGGTVSTLTCFLEGQDITIPDTDDWTVTWRLSRV